jgi:enoyl-CoA hydratase/carnithine racemase
VCQSGETFPVAGLACFEVRSRELTGLLHSERRDEMPEEILKVDRRTDGIVILTLNRPEVMNAINMAMSDALKTAFLDAAEDLGTRAVIITGAGDKAFSAGYDIHEMAAFGRKDMAESFAIRDPTLWEIANHPRPVIAALNGLAFGGGALIAAAADIRIGCDKTQFRVTSTSYGSANATWTLPHIVGMGRAKELLMTGRSVDADEAASIGLLNHVVPEDCLLDKALEIAGAIAINPIVGVREIKALLNDGIGRSYLEQFEAEHASVVAQGWSEGGRVFARFLSERGS